MVARDGERTRTLIAFDDIGRLPAQVRQLIGVLDAGVTLQFDRYTEAFQHRAARDPNVLAWVKTEIEDARRGLCADLNSLIGLLGSIGLRLHDHYHAGRHICAQPGA